MSAGLTDNDAVVDSNNRAAPGFYLGGIQVNEADHEAWANTVKKVGMNTVEVTVYAKQGDWDSDNLWYDKEDVGVLTEIRAAKKAGLHVVLILRVALDHAFERNKFLWHGMIIPKNDELLNSWFDKYQLFVEKWAKIAEQEGVGVLAVGSEMNALSSTIALKKMPSLYNYYKSETAQKFHEKRVLKFEEQLEEKHLWVRGNDNYESLEQYIDDKIRVHKNWVQQVTFADERNSLELMNKRRALLNTRWSKIIQTTRKSFSGKVTYAANFDNYFDVGFWKELDYIGINAYFPLRNPDVPYLTDVSLKRALLSGWTKVFEGIDEFRTKEGVMDKPLFFTELGYIYRRNTTIEPWSGFGFSVVGSHRNEWLIVWDEQSKDTEERALAVECLREIVERKNINLEGILYWKLTTHDYHIPVEPFVLHIAPNATDQLQDELVKFMR